MATDQVCFSGMAAGAGRAFWAGMGGTAPKVMLPHGASSSFSSHGTWLHRVSFSGIFLPRPPRPEACGHVLKDGRPCWLNLRTSHLIHLVCGRPGPQTYSFRYVHGPTQTNTCVHVHATVTLSSTIPIGHMNLLHIFAPFFLVHVHLTALPRRQMHPTICTKPIQSTDLSQPVVSSPALVIFRP